MTKILLTGAGGFVGSHILSRIASTENYEINALYRNSRSSVENIPRSKDTIKWIQGDINDIVLLQELMAGVDVVIHAAGNVSMRKRDKKNLYKDNVEATTNMVNMALECGVKKFVYISSTTSLGRRKKRETIDETAKWVDSAFNSYYGITKFSAEQEVWRAYHEGLNTTILCPSLILGPATDFSRSSVKLVDSIAGGLKYYPTGSNGFVDVRDVASAVLLAMNSVYDGHRYVLSACNLGYRELMTKIAEYLGVFPPHKKIAGIYKVLAKMAAWYGDTFSSKENFISRDALMTSMLELRYDASLSERELGVKYTPIEETIKDMVESFKRSVQN